MEKKNILVIVNEFSPFEGESFMDNEIPFINQFDKVIICPCSVVDFNKKINIKNDFLTVYPIPKMGKLIKIFKCIRSFFLKETIAEILFLYQNKNLNVSTLKNLLFFVSKGRFSYEKIRNYLKKNAINKSDHIVFYSYWMHFHAYAGLKLKALYSNSKVVSRCHRFDLYEYRNMNKYIPLRKYILENLDIIFSISDDGKKYLEKTYPEINSNIEISRLGTFDKGIKLMTSRPKIFKIVSCSGMVPVKRVHKIVNALSKIKDFEIEWTHFGGGQLFNDVKELTRNSLSDNIKVNLEGSISNETVLQKYIDNDFDVFINVSESEGVPVSIMEAMSFGIPIIATDVGGVNEIVFQNKNGNLLNKDFSDDELADIIKKFVNMTDQEYLKYRKCARDIWEQFYNAEINYVNFFNKLSRI